MKKIILMLILVPKLVFANVVYTEYEEYIMGTSDFLHESDTIKRSEYLIYNTYTEEIETKYQEIDEQSSNYLIDYNDFILEDNIGVTKNKYSYDYQTKCIDEHDEITNIYIKGLPKNLKISELEIIFPNEINYILKAVYHTGSKNALTDKDYYGEDFITTDTTEIGIYFNEKIKLEDLIIKIYLKKQEIDNSNFNIILNKYQNEKNLNGNFNLSKETDNLISITFDKDYNDFLLKNKIETDKKCISYYISKKILYNHQKTNKKILNQYIPLNNVNKFIMDDYIKKYNYYKREKIEIKNTISLIDETLDISKYVTTTIPFNKLKIIDNINYNNSGIYTLKIYYQDKLLLEKLINYKKTIKEELNKKEIQKFKTSKKIATKKNFTNNKKTSATTSTTTKIIKLNNKIVIKNKDNKKTVVIILSILTIVLIIFEIILLYVKHKYF